MPCFWSFLCLVQKKIFFCWEWMGKETRKKWNRNLQAGNILLMVMILLPLKRLYNNVVIHLLFCFGWRIRSNKKMLLLVGGLPPGPDRLPSNLVQYYDDEKKTWKILTSECLSFFIYPPIYFNIELSGFENMVNQIRHFIDLLPFGSLWMYHKRSRVKD